jgi:DnaJ-class molecular chaperone
MATRTDGGQTSPGSRDATTIRNPGDEAAPGTPQAGETTCPACTGTGRAQGGECPNCGGTGRVVQIVDDA